MIDRYGRTGAVSDNVWAQIYLLRPNIGALLPNLREVQWEVNNDHSALQVTPLISTSMRHLRFIAREGCSFGGITRVFQTLRKRLDTLQVLEV